MLEDFLLRRRWKKLGVKLSSGSHIDSITSIGYGTRINGAITIKGKGGCKIGRYCAFGDDIKIITSNHLTGYPNMQCSLQRRIGSLELDQHEGDVTIGHNVWIGDSAIILAGVSIGNGAVIGAGAVVTKNIAPFAIAVGVPAQLKRLRFSEPVCRELERVSWWNWDRDKLLKNKHFFNLNLSHSDSITQIEESIIN